MTDQLGLNSTLGLNVVVLSIDYVCFNNV